MEPKTERFKRIASARVNKITAMIRLLGLYSLFLLQLRYFL